MEYKEFFRTNAEFTFDVENLARIYKISKKFRALSKAVAKEIFSRFGSQSGVFIINDRIGVGAIDVTLDSNTTIRSNSSEFIRPPSTIANNLHIVDLNYINLPPSNFNKFIYTGIPPVDFDTYTDIFSVDIYAASESSDYIPMQTDDILTIASHLLEEMTDMRWSDDRFYNLAREAILINFVLMYKATYINSKISNTYIEESLPQIVRTGHSLLLYVYDNHAGVRRYYHVELSKDEGLSQEEEKCIREFYNAIITTNSRSKRTRYPSILMIRRDIQRVLKVAKEFYTGKSELELTIVES